MRGPCLHADIRIFKVIDHDGWDREKAQTEPRCVPVMAVKDCHRVAVDKEGFVEEVVSVEFLMHFRDAMRAGAFVRPEMGDIDQFPDHVEMTLKAGHMLWVGLGCSVTEGRLIESVFGPLVCSAELRWCKNSWTS
mgnify:CR=1 FL=1